MDREAELPAPTGVFLGGIWPPDKLNQVWLNPDGVQSLRLKLNVSIIIESSNCVASPNQTLEKLLRAHVIHNPRRILAWSVTSDANLVSDFELSFCHDVCYRLTTNIRQAVHILPASLAGVTHSP